METPSAQALDVQHLCKQYAGSRVNAVDDVSFTVPQGEIFGLLGPNGAGKTTLISILTTSALPTSGKALIAGIDIVSDPVHAKRYIGVVPQINNLDRQLTVRDILLFHARYHRVPSSEAQQRADQLLEELGLSKRSRDVLGRYSGGMAQRVMLARALMHAPLLLFLDEPTNNLDPQSRLFLWDRIRLLKEQGITVLLTTHDMEEADMLCDRLAIMDHGRVLVLDTPEALKKQILGGTSLELRVALPEYVMAGNGINPASSREQLQEILSQSLDAAKVEVAPVIGAEQSQAGEILYRVYGEHLQQRVGKATKAIVDHGAELQDLRLVQPGLEDVFIALTGRNLRS